MRYCKLYAHIEDTHVSTEEVAVPEYPEEVGDEEGAEHEDGGEQSSVRTRSISLK